VPVQAVMAKRRNVAYKCDLHGFPFMDLIGTQIFGTPSSISNVFDRGPRRSRLSRQRER